MPKIVVMVIDTEPFFRAGVHQTLSQLNNPEEMEILECESGGNGIIAMTKIASYSPDVVLLDIGYPFLGGLDLGRRIMRYFPVTKVVILSANPVANDDELFAVVKIGAVAYLRSNCCAPEEISYAIKRAANGEYPINDSVGSKPKVAWLILRQFRDMATTDDIMEDLTTPLTSKEMQILSLIDDGNSSKQISERIGISERTIKTHICGILRKLNANDRAHSVYLAIRDGWTTTGVSQNGDQRQEKENVSS